MRQTNVFPFPGSAAKAGAIYPYLRIRYGVAAGGAHRLKIDQGDYSFSLTKDGAHLHHPDPFGAAGNLSGELMTDLLWECLKLTRERGWRPTIRWSPTSSSTIWRNGIDVRSRAGAHLSSFPCDIDDLTPETMPRLIALPYSPTGSGSFPAEVTTNISDAREMDPACGGPKPVLLQ